MTITCSRNASDDGQLDLAALGVVTAGGLDGYHETRCLGRLPYDKAGMSESTSSD